MRYTEKFRMDSIPEWRSCYLNYEHLKVLLKIIRETVRERLELLNVMSYGTNLQARTQKTISISPAEIPKDKMEDIKDKFQYFVKISNEANALFSQAYQKNVQLYGDFVKYKYKEIELNFHACWKTHFIMEESDESVGKNLKSYVKLLFVESIYLTRMVQSNQQAEERILAKHKLYATNVFESPSPMVDEILPVSNCHQLRRQIERFYFRISQKPREQNRYQLRKLAQQDHIEASQTLFIGLLIGTVLTVIVFISIILARSNVTLNANTVFNKDFTLWRGISIFIFYIWILGVDFAYFEKYKISHRIILKNNYPKYPVSTDLFTIGGVFSIIFIIVFTIYALQIAGILEIHAVAPQWLPLFVWGPFLVFLFSPLPILYHYGRLTFFKMIFNAVMSVVFVVDFPKIWVTAQAISLVNVFQDLFYTFCFYSTLSFPYNPSVNVCKAPAIQAKFIYTVVIYSIRIIQCIKVGCGQGSYWKKSQFLNSIKFTLALLTTILAYTWNQGSNPNVFPAWVTFAIISTLASFMWDSIIGWDLFQLKSKNCMLRDQLIFPKRNYYIWLVLNFILRSAWTLNISPSIVQGFTGNPETFTLALGFLQIFRRGFWNFLRFEVEQIRNNQLLQALSKQKDSNQKVVYEFLSKNKERVTQNSMENLVESELIMISVKEVPDEGLQQMKQKIFADIKYFKKLCEDQKCLVEQKIEEINEKIAYLLKHIY